MPRDFMKDWFDHVASTRGECTDIAFARAAGDRLEWRPFPHREGDGVGAFVRIQRELGRIVAVPSNSRSGRVSLAAWEKAMNSHIYVHRLPPVRWRDPKADWRPGPPTARAGLVLSREESESAASKARRLGISLNSWLVWTADQAVLPFVQDLSGGKTSWMIPINMRSPGDERLSNRVVQIGVELERLTSPEEAHARIRAALSENVHWAMIRSLDWIGRIPLSWMKGRMERDMKAMYEREFSMGNGVLSNLGDWEVEGASADEGWVFIPPPLKIQPLTLGAIRFNGRLGLGVQAHPFLSARAEDAESWLRAWRDKLVSGNGTAERS
jgi:hypothetical protein